MASGEHHRASSADDRARRLLEAGMALSAELSLPPLLQRIVELAADICGARYGALAVLSPGGDHLVDFITTGISESQRAAIGDLPTGRGILGVLINEARPLRLRDIAADPRSAGFPPNHPAMHSFLGAPVRAHGRVFGNIYLTEKSGAEQFTEEDEAALAVLATQAGVAIANAQARRELARLALVEDRERIAKDLHDGVIQALFAVGLTLQGTATLVGDARLTQRLQEAVNEIDRVIGDLRNYIFGLRPAMLAEGNLAAALDQLGHEFQTRGGVTTIVDVDPGLESELSDRATHVIQLAREALSNVERHAQATTCRVSLRRDDGAAVLEVDDDGRGFDPTTVPADGMGLGNMRARADSLGGVMSIESAAGEGTTLRVTLPL